MFNRLWAACSRIVDAVNGAADAINTLADTFRQANTHLRSRLELDGADAQPLLSPPVVTVEPEKGRKKTAA